jgi:hypothetical protein
VILSDAYYSLHLGSEYSSSDRTEPSSEASYRAYIAELTLLQNYFNMYCKNDAESEFCLDLQRRIDSLTGKKKSSQDSILSGSEVCTGQHLVNFVDGGEWCLFTFG